MKAWSYRFEGGWVHGYGLALGSVLLVACAKLWLQPAWMEQTPFVGFLLAIALAARFGGPGPGVLATLLAAGLEDCFCLLPNQANLWHEASQGVLLLWFVFQGLLVTWLCTLLRIAEMRVHASATETRQYRDWLQRNEKMHQQHAEELAEASRLKDEFLATVSHELRTPLNAILGWAQLCRAGKLDDQGREHALQTIEQSAKTQARLIEDLLDISRIVTGKMRLDVNAVPLADVIEAAIETVRPAAEAKEICVRKRVAPDVGIICGDAKRLQQVVWNLLSNAIKFTPRGGLVQIQLERRATHIELSVSDTGAGIKPGFLPFVFDAFRQADSSSTRLHKGLGLGLDIVRRLVELHGGTVHAESAGEDRGAVFRVRLPASQAPPTPAALSAANSPDNGRVSLAKCPALCGLRVVVVDDDRDTRELLATVLRQCGVEVMAVASAADGLTAVREFRPHVLLSDIEMPDEDGYGLLGKVRALSPEQGGETPALALTAYAGMEDRRRALVAGFQMYLAKPIEPEELTAAVASLAAQGQRPADPVVPTTPPRTTG